MKVIFLTLLSIVINLISSVAALPLNQKLPEMNLSKESGGKLDGSGWSLKETIEQKKITVIFYVDPDVKDLNEEISQKLSQRNFSKKKVQYLAIINMAATWLPNFAIASALKKKQQKYPNTLYIKDFKKVGVKTWRVEDDQNNLIILNKNGLVIYSKFGKVPSNEIVNVMNLIESQIK